MYSFLVAASIFSLLKLTVYLGLALRLLSTGLFRTYRYFSAYILFEILRMVTAAIVPNRTDLYAQIYFVTQPVTWLLRALVVLELFKIALASRPGIATLGRKVVGWSVVTSMLVATGSIVFGVDEDSPYRVLEYYFLFERVISTTLLVFVLLLIGFLAHFPVPLSSNARAHAAVFGFYCTATTAGLYVRGLLGPAVAEMANTALSISVVVAVLAWTFLLGSQGELAPVRLARRRSEDDEQRLLRQLNAINQTLARSGRR